MLITHALIGSTIVAAAAVELPPEDAVWRDPEDSDHVRVHSCGAGLCGTVIWANDKPRPIPREKAPST